MVARKSYVVKYYRKVLGGNSVGGGQIYQCTAVFGTLKAARAWKRAKGGKKGGASIWVRYPTLGPTGYTEFLTH